MHDDLACEIETLFANAPKVLGRNNRSPQPEVP